MTKEQITKNLINLALIGCQRLNKQYQQYSKEIEEFTDHELFELISQYPTIHLKKNIRDCQTHSKGLST